MPAPTRLSLRSAALIAGLSLLLMVFAAPFAELYAFPKLIASGDAVETTHRLLAHRGLFVGAVMGYLLSTLRPFLYPHVRTDFAQFTFYGELAFMVWLLGWGWRIREPQGA